MDWAAGLGPRCLAGLVLPNRASELGSAGGCETVAGNLLPLLRFGRRVTRFPMVYTAEDEGNPLCIGRIRFPGELYLGIKAVGCLGIVPALHRSRYIAGAFFALEFAIHSGNFDPVTGRVGGHGCCHNGACRED